MKMILSTLTLVVVSGFSFGTYAACGGGGYTPRITTSASEYRSKLDDLRRDVEKAQRKLNQCVGDCDRERRKLDEAERKLAKKTAEASGR